MHPTADSRKPIRTALVLGARGRLGSAAVSAFAAAGWQVLAQARRTPGADWPAGVRHLDLALDDAAGLAEAAAGARVVVYAVNPLYTRWPQDMLPFARAGMAVAQRLGATFMLPGNVYNYGEAMPPLLRVDTPQAATTRKGQLRIDLEAEMAAQAGQGLRSVVLRAGDFFGGGPGDWLDQLIAKSVRQGKLVYPGPLDVAHAWAYLPDLAQALVQLAERADKLPAHARFHFPGHTLTGHQLLQHLGHAAGSLGLAPNPRAADGGFKRAGFPWPLIRLGGLVVPMWRELAEMSYLWRVPHALDGRLLQQAIGRVPLTPVEDALRAALRAMGPAPAATQPAATISA